MKKYTQIDLYMTEDKKTVKAIVHFEDGTVEQITENKEIDKAIEEFNSQEGIDVLNSEMTKLYIVKNVSLKKKIIKITSIGAALVLAILAGRAFKMNEDKSKTKKEVAFNTEDTLTREIPDVVIEEDVLPIVTEVPKVVQTENRLFSIVRRINNGERVSDDDLQYAMDEINQLSYNNTPGVASLLKGQKMYGKNEEVNFNDMFAVGSNDFIALSAFCNMRNDLINNAFAQNQRITFEEVESFLSTNINFIFNGLTFDYRDRYIGFYDLSPIARYMVIDMGMNMLNTDPNYKCLINGTKCDYYALLGEYAETFNTVTENLVNKVSFRK